MGYRDRVTGEGPRKLLSLDGGGIRGVLTLEILAEIEDIVRSKLGTDAVLGDYFDYIAGTSTGAIIAAGLSRGMPVSEIRAVYDEHGKEMFDSAFILDRYRYKFDSARLQLLMQRTFGAQTTFGDDDRSLIPEDARILIFTTRIVRVATKRTDEECVCH